MALISHLLERDYPGPGSRRWRRVVKGGKFSWIKVGKGLLRPLILFLLANFAYTWWPRTLGRTWGFIASAFQGGPEWIDYPDILVKPVFQGMQHP